MEMIAWEMVGYTESDGDSKETLLYAEGNSGEGDSNISNTDSNTNNS